MPLTGSEILIRGRGAFNQHLGRFASWTSLMPGSYQKRIEGRTVGSVTTFYFGFALPGVAEGTNEWMVVRLILDQTTELDVSETVANAPFGDDDDPFQVSWTGRAGHSYA